ncbi:PAS domain-containing sensor histidine kinase [Actinokineospora sp. NBRC 105648]|uniref:sensor histidine kinase n=1 Tax=Actinokineospora sp. NBRC 105648 TaxID=3032206 RepID=UPI0024A50DF9|nr:PAS domain-containing sensor histidine kinase [Actinokineospora sp. NBRC 105648]GLZ41374.1 hypothetical protein Acsp05_49980 [Actinokineospora sp. NBRC 105648]
MPHTSADRPWNHAAAVRAITRADRAGQATPVATGLLRALPGVLDAVVGDPVPGAEVVVPMASGQTLSLSCSGPADPRLAPLADTVAATLEAVAPAGVDFRDALIAQMPTFIALFSPDGLLLWTNVVEWPDGTRVAYGQTQISAITALVHPGDQGALAESLATLHERDPGGQIRNTVRVRRDDGGWIVMDVIVLDRVDDPAIGGLITFSSDVTALHDTEYTLALTAARLDALVGALHVGVLLQDADRTVLIANSTAATLLDLRKPPAELAGLGAEELRGLRGMPAEHYREIDELGRRCLADGVEVHGAEVALGAHRVVEVDFVPVVLDDRRLGQLWVLRDVTEQVELQRALVARNDELSRLAALKTEFIATVSHELRTPLTTLTTLTPMLTDGGDGLLAQAVERNVTRLAELVETLLFLAAVESRSRELEIVPTRLEPLVGAQVAALAAHASTRSVLVVHQQPGAVTVVPGDRELLARMVHHVLAAAIGSSPPSATVRVCSAREPEGWVLEVTDECPLTVDAGRLFTTVPRGDREGDPLIGSGLGLALARAIAERHGGAVYLRPARQGGTTVRVELPLAV